MACVIYALMLGGVGSIEFMTNGMALVKQLVHATDHECSVLTVQTKRNSTGKMKSHVNKR